MENEIKKIGCNFDLCKHFRKAYEGPYGECKTKEIANPENIITRNGWVILCPCYVKKDGV